MIADLTTVCFSLLRHAFLCNSIFPEIAIILQGTIQVILHRNSILSFQTFRKVAVGEENYAVEEPSHVPDSTGKRVLYIERD